MPQGADLVNYNGKTVTRSRALAMGWIDPDGAVTQKGEDALGPQVSKAKPASNGARRALREPVEPTTTPDGRIIAKREPKPLKPKNVTKTGEVIEDEETLKQIAAKTAAIEAEAAKKREQEAK